MEFSSCPKGILHIHIFKLKGKLKMNRPIFSILFSTFFLFVMGNFCMSATPSKEISRDEVLAKVNGEPITVGRFYDFLKESKITSSDPEKDQKIKEDTLHGLIRNILIDQKASSLDLNSDSGFVQQRDKHMQDFLLDYMYQKDIVEKVQITDQEVRSFFEKRKEQDFLIPEKVRVRDLLIRVWADSTKKDYRKNLKKSEKEAKKRIEELYRKATAGEDLADLCRQYFQGDGADISGDLGFIQRGQFSPQFDSIAFSLKEIKEFSKPVKDSRGYHLIQLLDRKEKSYEELDSTLFRGIREVLKNERIKEATKIFLDSLKNATEFVYNWEILNATEPPLDKNTWVLIFGGQDTIRYKEYEETLSTYKADRGKDSLTTDDKKNLLTNSMIFPMLLVREAEKRGYAGSGEYLAEKRAFTLEEAEKRLMAERVKEDFPPPAMEEIKSYYQAHKIDFPPLGVPVHVYHMVFNDSVKAVKVLNQINNGADFVELAKKHFTGESEIKDVAYDLGFISQGEMPDEFYRTALSLKEGEVSQPVRTNWGFHLIKVVEKKERGTTFEEIIPRIEKAINLQKARNHVTEWEGNLFKQANIWINKKLLQKLELPKPEG